VAFDATTIPADYQDYFLLMDPAVAQVLSAEFRYFHPSAAPAASPAASSLDVPASDESVSPGDLAQS
jgi:hypothetical protein